MYQEDVYRCLIIETSLMAYWMQSSHTFVNNEQEVKISAAIKKYRMNCLMVSLAPGLIIQTVWDVCVRLNASEY